jgi:hypothetical protein
MTEDPRLAAARYRVERLAREADGPAHEGPDADDPASPAGTTGSASSAPQEPARGSTAAERAAYVENAIQQAIRRGDFDNLPGAGKPLPGLSGHHDPDWWIKRKIESEKLTGLGPAALRLRVESAELAETLDAFTREEDVREAVEDFNRRVIEARRQLLGGPPVVTPTRDVDDEVREWRARRAQRQADAAAQDAPPARPRRRWWRRHPSS